MSSNGCLRILIADDYPIVRQGLRQILSHEFEKAWIGEASNGCEVLRLVEEENWDLVVLDICMPGRNGLECLRDLKNRRPSLPVLILSMYPEDQFAERAISSGADGYLSKESAPDQLVTAIRKVIGGGKYISSAFAERFVFWPRSESDKPWHESLSNREYQIMLMIAGGSSLSTIARELSLSVKTISTYRGRLLRKLRMESNAQLIRYAIKEGLAS